MIVPLLNQNSGDATVCGSTEAGITPQMTFVGRSVQPFVMQNHRLRGIQGRNQPLRLHVTPWFI